MSRLIVFFLLCVLVTMAAPAEKDHKHKLRPIKGVSEESRTELQEALKAVKSREDRKKTIGEWIASLDEAEKKAAETHFEIMSKKIAEFKKNGGKGKRGDRKQKGGKKGKKDGKRGEKKRDGKKEKKGGKKDGKKGGKRDGKRHGERKGDKKEKKQKAQN